VELAGDVVSHPPFAPMYWSPAHQMAHLTANGANLRTGDLFASGTVSGPEPGQRGSFIELTWNGAEPLTLSDGSTRAFLQDGDQVRLSGVATGRDGVPVGLGEVTGRILPPA
jgi:fumarylacetoacetase